jgi:hypothetical protein
MTSLRRPHAVPAFGSRKPPDGRVGWRREILLTSHFHFDRDSGGGGRLPEGGWQDAKVVPVGHGRKPFEDVGGTAEAWHGMVVRAATFHSSPRPRPAHLFRLWSVSADSVVR